MNVTTRPKSLRRFEELPMPVPSQVRELPPTHPAMIGKEPLYRNMVFPAGEVENIFVSGVNNRKIGRVVIKGAWRSMPIYMLTLPERATCPESCRLLGRCYGNAMHRAKRIAPGEALEERIRNDIDFLSSKHMGGFVVRLHVLGDFYSVPYVELWEALLEKHAPMHVYGYTARRADDGDGIAKKIEAVKTRFKRRFAIRWSRDVTGCAEVPDTATVILHRSEAPEGAIVCPAETDDTACCATCGLCWEAVTSAKTICFLLHGMGSSRASAEVQKVNDGVTADGIRAIAAFPEMARLATAPIGKPPRLQWVKPTDLHVEACYQRDLTKRSYDHIRRIVRTFDWGKFAPPACAEVDGRIYVYDGQHTAIATASHPDIDMIPIMVVDAMEMERRAALFIGKNWERIQPSALQKYKAMVASRDSASLQIQRITDAAGVTILAHPPANGRFKPGETIALKAITTVLRKYGEEPTKQVLELLKGIGQAPLRADHIRAVAELLHANEYRGTVTAARLAKLISEEDYDSMLIEARRTSKEMRVPVFMAFTINYHHVICGESHA